MTKLLKYDGCKSDSESMITNTPGCILSISSFEEFQNRLSFLTQSSSGVITGVPDLFLVLMFYPVEIFDVNIDWNPLSIHLNLSVFTGQKV